MAYFYIIKWVKTLFSTNTDNKSMPLSTPKWISFEYLPRQREQEALLVSVEEQRRGLLAEGHCV